MKHTPSAKTALAEIVPADPSSAGHDDRLFELLGRVTGTLGDLLGPTVELVLHDLRDLDHTVVAIANGEMTGRVVGDTIEPLGLHLFEQHDFRDMANYETRTWSGRTLRSCSVFVRDAEGKPIGALCVNQDLSPLLKMRDWLETNLRIPNTGADAVPERSDNSVEDVLSNLITDAIHSIGRAPESFTREDKMAVVSYLDARGAFLVRYSMEKVATLLGISKFSIYNYLGERR